MSILFSKICQFLTFYLVKSSPKNPRWKLERRRSICAGTVSKAVLAEGGVVVGLNILVPLILLEHIFAAPYLYI